MYRIKLNDSLLEKESAAWRIAKQSPMGTTPKVLKEASRVPGKVVKGLTIEESLEM